MTSRRRRWRWVRPSPSVPRSGKERTVADSVSAVALPIALRPLPVPLFSATSPPRPPLARRPVRRRNRSARDRLDQTHVRSGAVSCRFRRTRAVDIEQSFESNVRSMRPSTEPIALRRWRGADMGCVQQAVLEFDEEVRAPWRPRLVSDAGATVEPVRHPSRRAPSRVGVCEASDGRAAPARRRSDDAPRRVAVRSAAVPAATVPSASTSARRAVPSRKGSARLRLTRRARQLAFVLALASGVALGSWLGPMIGGDGTLRLAGGSAVVVQSGDTLWSIADTVAGPGDDVRAVVDEIQRVNGLRTADLVPGQVLQLP